MKTLSPMQKEAASIAAFIFSDLRLDRGEITFERVWRLCTDNGYTVHVYDHFPKSLALYTYNPGKAERGMIMLSGQLTLSESVGILLHELTHRLVKSPRYEELNCGSHEAYDYTDFHEALARAMERQLINRGIPSFLGARY